MENANILDLNSTPPASKSLKGNFPISLKKYGIVTVLQLTFNMAMIWYLFHNSDALMFEACTVTMLVLFPLTSAVLGLLLGLFPFRKLPFKVRYFRSVLLTYSSLISAITLFLLWGVLVSQINDVPL